ncbi:replication stress response regulator SDE2-like [Pecten maximus]|uniref:replication stress response regulator SDE2-like n=1 Tax=Pecten maximus TaxID=6579 RepID=UPI001458D709|nr:replication stress response regulator SDE2-like [Pecten maximus]
MNSNICIVDHSSGNRCIHIHNNGENVTLGDLLRSPSSNMNYSEEDVYITSNGKIVHFRDSLQAGGVYHVILKLLGGKGGFGSMLRAIGAQIEKTTNHEACRDLSGRRMRDVNNEKQLKEWIGKKAQKEKEEEEKRQERLAKRRALPNHKFDDPQYDQQKNLVAENLEDALQKGLQKAQTMPGPSHSLGAAPVSSSSSECRKRTTDSQPHKPAKVKKTTEWLGFDIEDLSDSDENDDISCTVSGREPVNSNSSDSTHCTDNGVAKDMETGDIKNLDESEHSGSENVKNSNSENISLDKTETLKDSSGNRLLTALRETPPKLTETLQQQSEQDELLDLDRISSVEELEALSLDKLKKELMARGMKCGGTLQQRAERLYSVRGLTSDQIKPSLLAKRT